MDVQYYAGECMFNLKKFELAVREYQAIYRRYPKGELAASAPYNEGWFYYELQNPGQMIEVFKTLVQKAAEFYSKLKNKYPIYEKISEVDKLIYDLSQINSYLEYEAAMKHFDKRKYEKAFEKLKKF